MSSALYVFMGLSVLAGISVLRNPLQVWPNILAGLSYFAGAGAAYGLRSWWPILAGWLISLSLQALCMALLARGVFDRQVNLERARRGLPPRE